MNQLIALLALALVACGPPDRPDVTDATGVPADTDTTTSSETDTPTTSSTASTTDSSTTDTTSGSTTATQCPIDVCKTYPVPTLQAVAGQIVDAVVADPEFAGDFAGVNLDRFKVSFANFVTDFYGCTVNKYTGPTMQEAHAGMNIRQSEYDDFVGIIASVLQIDGVPQDQIDHCFAPPLMDPALANTIIGQ